MAALIAIHGDDNGLALPTIVAPFQVVVVPIFRSDEEKQMVAGAIDELVQHIPQRHIVDWGTETPGFKFNQWEMKGVPVRIELGPKDIAHGTVVLKRRFGEKLIVKANDFPAALKEELRGNDHDLHERAKEYFANNIRSADTLPEITKLINEFRGFIVTNWCSLGKEGAACAEKFKEATQGGFVAGERLDETQSVLSGVLCAVCGSAAKHRVYVAKRY